MKLTDFDRVHLLALDKRKNFWRGIDKQFANHGVKVERFIVGKGNDPTLTYSMVDGPDLGTWNNNYSNNARYAYEAHRKMLQSAIDDNLNSLLLLEDDVVLTEDFDETLEVVSKEIEENDIQWDSLNLGGNLTWSTGKRVSSHLIKNLEGAYCFQCIGLKRPVIQALLDAPPIGPMDFIHARIIQPTFDCFSVFPPIAPQRNTFSYVNGRNEDYSSYYLNLGKII